jgi:[ribosomal protein S5]-alanine N-acetyltransferase
LKFYENENIYLRLLNISDADIILNWFYDREVTKFNSHGIFPKTKKEVIHYIENSFNENKLIFAICCNFGERHDNLIGTISLQEINWINRSAELAFLINRDYWGKGIATQAGKMMLKHAFCKLNLHRVWMGTPILHIGMLKVSDKLGFTEESKLREAFYMDGLYCCISRFSILEKEYFKRMETI